jgi:hypothetical protein
MKYSSAPALTFYNSGAANKVSHCQFAYSWSLFTQANSLRLLNVLFDNVPLLVEGTDYSAHAEHVTARTGWAIADDWGTGTGTITYLNSLLVNIPDCWASGAGGCSVGSDSYWIANDEPALFQTVGAGNYYLANGSTHRDSGTTSIDNDLKTALARMTTYPPEILSGTAPPNLILGPRLIGDTELLATIIRSSTTRWTAFRSRTPPCF